MSELKITQNSLENAILKGGQFVSGYVADSGSINVSGYGAHAEGYAVGRNIDASGNGAHAEGISTQALADGAHAEGYDTSALGYASHVSGIGTIADQEAMTAIGKYNNTSVGKIGGDYLFVVGNGTAPSDASRSNAFAVTTNGITATTLNLSGGRYQEESNPDTDIPGGKITWSDGNCYIEETDEDKLTIYAENGLQLETAGLNININNNTIIDGNVKAKVNDVSNVYLGCPIGTVVMWAGVDTPKDWLLCDGSRILYKNNKSIEQTIQGIHFKENELYNLTHIIGSKYGSFTVRKATLKLNFNGLKASGYIKSGQWDGDNFIVNTPQDFTNILSEAYKFYDLPDTSILTTNAGYSITIDSSNYTQCLPNFKGLFPIGAGEGTDTNGKTCEFHLGDYTCESNGPGEYSHTLTAGESGLPAHTHAVPTGGATTSGAAAAQKGAEADWDPFSTANAGGVAAQQAHNNIPPYLAINFIIKYK